MWPFWLGLLQWFNGVETPSPEPDTPAATVAPPLAKYISYVYTWKVKRLERTTDHELLSECPICGASNILVDIQGNAILDFELLLDGEQEISSPRTIECQGCANRYRIAHGRGYKVSAEAT